MQNIIDILQSFLSTSPRIVWSVYGPAWIRNFIHNKVGMKLLIYFQTYLGFGEWINALQSMWWIVHFFISRRATSCYVGLLRFCYQTITLVCIDINILTIEMLQNISICYLMNSIKYASIPVTIEDFATIGLHAETKQSLRITSVIPSQITTNPTACSLFS